MLRRLLLFRSGSVCTSRSLTGACAFSSESKAGNEFDYVVVGAGSAGSVLTYRLSAAGYSVACIEAGPADDDDIIRSPMRWFDLFYNKKYNWNYWTAAQQELAGRRVYWPRGKALGGSSSINAMVYVRPHPLDLDRWAFKESAYGWSYADTLPYFKRLESFTPDRDDFSSSSSSQQAELLTYRGFDGPMRVTSGKLRNKLNPSRAAYEAFLDAAQQAGLPFTHDNNGYRQHGAYWLDTTTHNASRFSAVNAYLKLALDPNSSSGGTGTRARVSVMTDTMCSRLLFDASKTRVIGVEIIDAKARNAGRTEETGNVSRVYASKDVIVSGGAINSPQLLQLSGIGHADELKQVGIEPVVHLPGVGKNLQDHYRCVTAFLSNELPSHKLHDAERYKAECNQWHNHGTGYGAFNVLEAGAHFCTSDDIEHSNVQLFFLDRLVEDVPDVAMKIANLPAVFFSAYTQREYSRGYLKVNSANPFDHPLINPQIFTDPRDIKEMIETFKFCRVIAKQKAFAAYNKVEVFPGPDVTSDNAIEQVLRQSISTSYHPSGTCKMGDITKDPSAVVDPRSMRVYGVDGLRVIDASVMPSEPSCNLNAPTLMIAERSSDLILGKKPLAPQHAPFHRNK